MILQTIFASIWMFELFYAFASIHDIIKYPSKAVRKIRRNQILVRDLNKIAQDGCTDEDFKKFEDYLESNLNVNGITKPQENEQ